MGLFLVMHSIYEQRYLSLASNKMIEYRFIPRTYYEEQIESVPVSSLYKNMFQNRSVWQELNRIVGHGGKTTPNAEITKTTEDVVP